MATPYEVEHNIKAASGSEGRRRRQIDMSTFNSHLASISTRPEDHSTAPNASSASPLPSFEPHNNPHAVPTPADRAAVFRLVHDQLATLARTAPTTDNRDLLSQLLAALAEDAEAPPDEIAGVSQAYVDALDRVPRKRLGTGEDATCPICADRFLDDPYPLVVQLPCHGSHRFDLECVAPWLRSKGTCPLCRMDLAEKERGRKKKVEVRKEDEDDEEEDQDMLYA